MSPYIYLEKRTFQGFCTIQHIASKASNFVSEAALIGWQGRRQLYRALERLKKSWRPAAWLLCWFLILTQVVALGVYLPPACFATTPCSAQ